MKKEVLSKDNIPYYIEKTSRVGGPSTTGHGGQAFGKSFYILKKTQTG